MQCKYCACTDQRACEGGCTWIADEICSACVVTVPQILLAELLTVTVQAAQGILQPQTAHKAMELYKSLSDAGDAPDYVELLERLGEVALEMQLRERIARQPHLLKRPDILIATEADIPPFSRELQL